jgi:hypothetical protein
MRIRQARFPKETTEKRRHIGLRTAAVAFTSIITGGAAGRLAAGGGSTISTARAIGAGFAAGSTGSAAGLATSDAYNVYISHEQQGFSSPEEYVKTALVGGAFGGALGGVAKGLSNRSRGYVPEEALRADDAASISEISAKPYRAIENPRVAAAATEAGIDVASVSDFQFDLLRSADVAVANRDIHAAIQIGDELVKSGLPKQSVTTYEHALANTSGTTDPAVYRDPHAVLPDGRRIAPSTFGGDLYYGTDEVPPAVAFEKGFPARGPNVKLLDHVHQAGDRAFRGTTRTIFTPDGERGAGQWAGADGWVYKIDGTPSWDVNASLEARVPRADGLFGNNPMRGELEQAVLGNIPRERIVGAIKMIERGEGLIPGPLQPNPNYKPLK